jgi:hypothetical protein
MEKHEELLIERHIHTDEELRRYVQEHRQFNLDLEALNGQAHLTPEEEVQRKILQKKKLLGKERIFEILKKYQQA